MTRTILTRTQTLSLLEETPKRISAATETLTQVQLRKPEARGAWSINDVLAHLRSCADARGDFTKAMLAEDRPTLRAIDPRAWITQTDYPDLDFASSFASFRRQRARLLRFLKSLPEQSWSRTAIVTGGGPPRERTVLFYAQWVARHERPHVKQIERIATAMRG